ncbi:unnamed protein product [Amoebophrya sp. A25]|nr:unnamed protein product [Amoebophrya sp. A25]|eukprot:GSA25T00010698001.1
MRDRIQSDWPRCTSPVNFYDVWTIMLKNKEPFRMRHFCTRKDTTGRTEEKSQITFTFRDSTRTQTSLNGSVPTLPGRKELRDQRTWHGYLHFFSVPTTCTSSSTPKIRDNDWTTLSLSISVAKAQLL